MLNQKRLAADMKKSLDAEYYSIIEQYQDDTRRLIYMTVKNHWVADDLNQETFIKAYKSLNSLKDPTKIKSWLMRIAYNLCMDYFKSSSEVNIENIEKKGGAPLTNILSVGKQMEREEMSECVQDKMLLLPHSYRTILYLFDVVEFTHKEIAEILGESETNVKTRLHRARQKFKKILKGHCTFSVDERAVFICSPK